MRQRRGRRVIDLALFIETNGFTRCERTHTTYAVIRSAAGITREAGAGSRGEVVVTK